MCYLFSSTGINLQKCSFLLYYNIILQLLQNEIGPVSNNLVKGLKITARIGKVYTMPVHPTKSASKIEHEPVSGLGTGPN